MWRISRGKKKKKSRFLLRLKGRHVLREKYSGFSKAPKSRNGGGVRHCFQGCRFASFVRGWRHCFQGCRFASFVGGWAGRAGSWEASPTQAGGRRRSSTLFFRGPVSAEPRKLEPVLKIMTSSHAGSARGRPTLLRSGQGQAVPGARSGTRRGATGRQRRESKAVASSRAGSARPPPLLPAGGRGARPRGAESG